LVYIVTGAAGFIGSTLVDRLLSERRRVIGIDCFRDYYPVERKRANLAGAMLDPMFRLVEADLADGLSGDLGLPPGEQAVVYHLAAQAGVRASWGRGFDAYVRDNITATASLLDWCCESGRVRNLVFASSSSVYGDAGEGPSSEHGTLPQPVSPYGVTKLAAEHLVRLHTPGRGLPTVSARLFSVYGPRQRPDMAFYRFMGAALTGGAVEIHGDGSQTRDFTYVDDVVEGLRRLESVTSGDVYNIGGGSAVRLSFAVETIARLAGCGIRTRTGPPAPGDARATLADASRLDHDLGWRPATPLEEGLAGQMAWMRGVLGL
jgi:UDP-glucose 4-epimerase